MIVKRLKPSKNLHKNNELLNFSRDIYECTLGICKNLEKNQARLILCSSDLSKSSDCSNVFLKRMGKDVMERIKGLEKNEFLSLDLEKNGLKNGAFKSS